MLKYEIKERNIDLEKKKQVKKHYWRCNFLKNLRFWSLTRDKKIKRNEIKKNVKGWNMKKEKSLKKETKHQRSLSEPYKLGLNS